MTTMKYIAILIFISFLGLAVFSISAFNHRINDMHMHNCLDSQIGGTPCPTSLVASLIHHTSTFQTLFNTLITSLVSVLVLVFVVFWSKDFIGPKLKFLYQKLRNFKLIVYKAKQRFISWLSLFENSPSLT